MGAREHLTKQGSRVLQEVDGTRHRGLSTPSRILKSPSVRLVAQSYPTLCDPMDGNSPGSSVHGILPARILEWVAIPSSRGSSRPGGRTYVSCIADRFFAG